VEKNLPQAGRTYTNMEITIARQTYSKLRRTERFSADGVSEMTNSSGLAMDKHGSILVADEDNRLLMIDSSLTCAHEMSVSVDDRSESE